MNSLRSHCVTVLAICFQVFFFPHLVGAYLLFDPVGLLIASYGLRFGARGGFCHGLVVGVVIDVFSSGYFGINAATYALMGLFFGGFFKILYTFHITTMVLVVPLVPLVHTVVHSLVFMLLGVDLATVSMYWSRILPLVAGNAVIIWPLYFVLRRFQNEYR